MRWRRRWHRRQFRRPSREQLEQLAIVIMRWRLGPVGAWMRMALSSGMSADRVVKMWMHMLRERNS